MILNILYENYECMDGDSLYYCLKYNYADFIDYLCSFAACFEIDCFYPATSRPLDISAITEKILNLKANSTLKDCFILIQDKGIGQHNHRLVLKFKINESSIAWLKTHKDLSDFGGSYYSGRYGNLKTPRYCMLRDACFLDTDDKPIIGFFAEETYFPVSEEYIKRLEKWAAEKLSEKKSEYNGFTSEWNLLKERGEAELINRFAADKYPMEIFFRVFKRSENHFYGVSDFFENERNVMTFQKIIIEKLKRGCADYWKLRLFDWYDLRYNDGGDDGIFSYTEKYGFNTVTEYLLSLPSDRFAKLFNRALEYKFNERISRRIGWHFLYNVISLWNKYGLSDDCLESHTFVKIKNCWKETYPVNDDSVTYSFRLKKKFLTELLALDFRAEGSRKLFLKELTRDKFSLLTDKAKLGYAYYYGICLPQNYGLAAECFSGLVSIDAYVDCQYDLAYCYEQGLGVEKDLKQARYWFEKAKENGHPKAAEQLAALGESFKDKKD